MANFGAILDKNVDSIERPKPLPQGTYLCVVQGLPRQDVSSQKKTEFVEFTLKVLEARDDVDADALEAIGGIMDKTLRSTYYLTEDAAWRLKKFLYDDLQLEEGESMRPALEQAPGQQVLAKVTHTPSKDGQTFFANVNDTAPVE